MKALSFWRTELDIIIVWSTGNGKCNNLTTDTFSPPRAWVRYEVSFKFKLSSMLYLCGCDIVINILFYCTRTVTTTDFTHWNVNADDIFHWLQQKFPFWQPPLQPTSDENLSKRQHEHFSANTKIIRAFCSCSDHSQYGVSQWEPTLQSNVDFHWLSP